MQDLYLEVTRGVGFSVEGKEVKSCNTYLTDVIKREEENKFSIFVYGHPVYPTEAKSVAGQTCNLIGRVNCNFIGLNREFHNPIFETACSVTDSSFEGQPIKNIIVVESLFLDNDETEDVEKLLSGLDNIVKTIAGEYFDFDSDNTVVCVFANKEDMTAIKKVHNWERSFTDNEDGGIIILCE